MADCGQRKSLVFDFLPQPPIDQLCRNLPAINFAGMITINIH